MGSHCSEKVNIDNRYIDSAVTDSIAQVNEVTLLGVVINLKLHFDLFVIYFKLYDNNFR
jgi:hypothetical protein